MWHATYSSADAASNIRRSSGSGTRGHTLWQRSGRPGDGSRRDSSCSRRISIGGSDSIQICTHIVVDPSQDRSPSPELSAPGSRVDPPAVSYTSCEPRRETRLRNLQGKMCCPCLFIRVVTAAVLLQCTKGRILVPHSVPWTKLPHRPDGIAIANGRLFRHRHSTLGLNG